MRASCIERYLASVGGQIRWKRARRPLLDELEAHIDDRRSELIRQGNSPEEAARRAVAEMGDPEEVGLSLDRIHRPRPDWAIMGCAAALLVFGLMLMWMFGDRRIYFGRMAFYALLGIAAMAGGYFLDYTALARLPEWPLFALCGACCALPVVDRLFFTTAVQLCHALPVLFLPLAYRAGRGEKKSVTAMLLGFYACQAAALMTSSWISMHLYIMVVCGVLMIISVFKGLQGKRRLRVLLAAFLPPIAAFLFLCAISSHSLVSRLTAVIAPESDPMGTGWIPLRIREILSSARLFGKGEGGELTGVFVCPSELTSVDYTLAAASHTLGYIVYIAAAALILGFGALLVRGTRRQSCGFGRMSAICIGLCFGYRSIFYLLSNLGFPLIYSEGIPFFSFCGKLMVVDMFMAGLLLSVFRMGSIARDSSIRFDHTAAD